MHARWVTVGNSGLCCCTCVKYFECQLTPLCVYLLIYLILIVEFRGLDLFLHFSLPLPSEDLLCFRSSRSKYNASTVNYLLQFAFLHFDLRLVYYEWTEFFPLTFYSSAFCYSAYGQNEITVFLQICITLVASESIKCTPHTPKEMTIPDRQIHGSQMKFTWREYNWWCH